MISKLIYSVLFALTVFQLSQALKYCNCDIEYTDGDPDIVFTEFKQCAYKEYESIRIEVESTECESSSSRYDEKQEVLKELEMARYELEEFLSELNRSILKRMKEAFLKFGCTTSSEYKSLVADILSDSESEVEQRITKFRNGFAKCKSFVTSVVGKIANKFHSKITGLFGGKGTSSSKHFCGYEIDYIGDDPEIILNEIKKSTYKDYNNVKRELESMDYEESSTKYEEKMSMLKELEMSRYRLDEYLCDLGVSVLEQMKGAYLEHGGAFSPKFKSLIVNVLSETEAQVRPYLQELRDTFSRCKSFVGDTNGGGGEKQTETERIEKRSSVSQTRKICNYDIEYSDEDPSIIMTEIRQCAYREYEDVKIEVESTECESSSSQYEEKQKLLKELEMARFELDKYLSDKNKSIMKRMKEAYLKFGSTTCSEYKKLVTEILSETEAEVGPRIMEFRNGFDKCKSFVGSIVGSLANKFKSKLRGIFGGKSSHTSKSRNFCDNEIDYVGNDPEIILNEIKKSTYKEYNRIKKELESMNCDQSSSKYEQKIAMLKELEMSRYKLEENLSDLGVSVLEKMKEAYLKHGGAISPKFKSLIVDVLSDTESQVRPYLRELRNTFSRCKSFVGGANVDGEKQTEMEQIEKRSSVSQTRKICNYDIEYSDEDPSIIMTEIRQCAYREYEDVKVEVESTECESSSSQYEEKQELLKELEMARFELDKYLSDKNKSIMKRMKEAYLKFGSTACSEYKKLVAEILSETEAEVGPRIIEFRNGFDKCKSFVSSIVGSLANKFKSKLSGVFGGKSSQTSTSRNFCDVEIDYIGNDPEIILNEIKKSTFKKYNSIKKELESMNCDQSSPKYEEKVAMLKELEMSRYTLEEKLSDVGVSVLEKMKEAYLKLGGAISPKFKSLIVDILSETEAQVRPYLKEIRDKFSQCKMFVGGNDVGREKRSTTQTRKICSYDIEYSDDEDPDIMMTEIRQCTYREYEIVRRELESMECESSSQQYEEKQELLKELELARFELDKYLSELNKSTLKRMKEAYLKFGSTTCSKYKTFIAEFLKETESEVGPRIMEFRNGFEKYKSFVGSIVGNLADKFKFKVSGIFGGKSSQSSSSRQFCDYKIEYLGNDPEIILNEIKKSTYREYLNVRRELESMNCEQSTSKYEEKVSMLKNLEMSRYRLEEFLCDLSVSILERMKGAYLEYGGIFSPKFKSLIVEVLNETEEQVRPYLQDFHKEYSRCRSFSGGSSNVVSRTKSSVRGMISNTKSTARGMISGSFSRMRS